MAALSAAAVWYCHMQGWTLYYGDAEAHLDIARRVVDSRTPGFDQLGTVWPPLPHILMLPFVGNDWLWRTGLAGAIPSACAFIAASLFLAAATRLVTGSSTAAAAAAVCFALSPNLLYLQAIPMTEPIVLACVMALLYWTLIFGRTQSLAAAAAAGLASLAASLTRYDGWLLIPFVTFYMLIAGGRRRWVAALLAGSIASVGPLVWFAYNWWFYGNPLEFYNGPYSALAITGKAAYPGLHDWGKAWLYYRTVVQLFNGWGALAVGGIGFVALLARRAWWPLVFLLVTPSFYIWSLHSSGTPIFVPTLWPHSYYNTRFGVTALPLMAFGAGVLVACMPVRLRALGATAIAVIVALPWLLAPHPDSWVCWKESQVNSEARRDWTRQTAAYLRSHYRSGTGIFSELGDMAGVFREAGIPLREVLQEGNEPAWEVVIKRPDLFLHEEWAVVFGEDEADKAVKRLPKYQPTERIAVKDARPVDIYRNN